MSSSHRLHLLVAAEDTNRTTPSSLASLTGVCMDCNWSEGLESARESGILVAMTKPDAGGLPCAFQGNATRCSRSLKRIYRETHLPHLTQPQLTGLAWWVCGTILAGSACQNAFASALSIRGNWNNLRQYLRQYLREWLYDGGDRARPCKTELDVSLCFAPLLRWVLAWWRSGRLVLAVDPTLKGDDTTAIVISVVYRGCAIPVAWRILRANKPGA